VRRIGGTIIWYLRAVAAGLVVSPPVSAGPTLAPYRNQEVAHRGKR
jgi:hypothetical protein